MTHTILWIPPTLGAIGVGLLLYAILSGLTDLFRYGLGRRSYLTRVLPRSEDRRTGPLSEEAVYGLPENLLPWMGLAALVGVVVSILLLSGPLRTMGLVAGVLPMYWRRGRMAQARLDTRRQISHLIEEMRLHLTFLGSLGPVLSTLSQGDYAGVVYERLRAHRDLITVSGAEEVLELLAEELRSPELRMLLRRIEASRHGSTSYADALRAAADEVTEEIVRKAEVEVEGAPMKLLFPMMMLLFPPVLVLTLFPPALRLIDQLTGTGF